MDSAFEMDIDEVDTKCTNLSLIGNYAKINVEIKEQGGYTFALS